MEVHYFRKLTENKIDTFCDIRRHRGIRGSKYSFVNSIYLQSRIQALNIKYRHCVELAPTPEIRDLQKRVDSQRGENKRDRNVLHKSFKEAYIDRVLNKVDFHGFVEQLYKTDSSRIVFFCLEDKPEACHRSIITEKLEKLGYKITHL